MSLSRIAVHGALVCLALQSYVMVQWLATTAAIPQSWIIATSSNSGNDELLSDVTARRAMIVMDRINGSAERRRECCAPESWDVASNACSLALFT
jgi:hypothetical protein